jgi:hypothetical protein
MVDAISPYTGQCCIFNIHCLSGIRLPAPTRAHVIYCSAPSRKVACKFPYAKRKSAIQDESELARNERDFRTSDYSAHCLFCRLRVASAVAFRIRTNFVMASNLNRLPCFMGRRH